MQSSRLFDLSQKTALLNGAGAYALEIATGLAQAGTSLYLADADPAALADLSQQLEKQGLEPAATFLYQPGTAAAARQLADWIKAQCGALDIFIENATDSLHQGWDISYAEIIADLEKNQLGLMLTCQAIGQLMAEQKKGSVIFITDYTALVGCDVNLYQDPDLFEHDFSLTYGFVKGSLVNYTRQAAGFLGESNVRCNCLALAPKKDTKPDDFAAGFIRHSHLKRMAEPVDIQGPVLFLASDAASYITGTTIPVDGGYTAK